MLRRRMMMTRAQGGVQLPAGYTPLEYIETDGNSYIDTFYNPNQNTRVVMKVSEFPNTSNAVLFGARTSISSSDKFAFIASGSRVYRVSFYNKDIELAASISYSGEMVVDQNKNTTYLNGSAVATAPTGAFSCPYTLHLFSCNNGGTPSGYCKVKFYYCQIHDNGVLVRDFIPCTNPDGISGLWDSVNNVFYKMLPAGYTKLDFIETDGTAYIDTGFIPNGNTRVVADMLLVQNNTAQSANEFFGARTSASALAYALQYNNSRGNMQLFYWNGYSELADSFPSSRVVYDLNKNVLSYDGKSISRTYGDWIAHYPMYIFALNNAGTPTFMSIARLYSFRIYDNGTLVRDFIPAMNASGEAGLYDLKNDVWYALLPVVKPKVENKIRVRQGSFKDRFGREGIEYGFIAQYSLASDVTIYYKGDNFSLDSRFSGSFIMNKGSSSVYKVVTNVFDVGLGIVGQSIDAITSISPTEDDTYIYTF